MKNEDRRANIEGGNKERRKEKGITSLQFGGAIRPTPSLILGGRGGPVGWAHRYNRRSDSGVN